MRSARTLQSDNGQRSTKLSDCIREHERVQSQYPSEETIEAEEPTRSDDQRSTTLEMNPFLRKDEVCSEEDVDIPYSGMMNVEKKSR